MTKTWAKESLKNYVLLLEKLRFRLEIMEDTGIEIDLYADMDSEFPKEEFKTEKNNLKEVKTEAVDDTTGVGSEGSELYDNVLINIKGEKNTDDDPENCQSLSSSQEYEIRKSSVLPKRYQVYV